MARWGYATNLFAWEFWNEVPPTPEQVAWVAEMAAYLKEIDPNRHMVSTTYGDASTWDCPDIDFTMTHFYGSAGNIEDFTPIVREDRGHGSTPSPISSPSSASTGRPMTAAGTPPAPA